MSQEKALVVAPGQSAVEIYRMSTDAAGMCKEIVVSSAVEIQGRKYVKVEGWQAIAIAHGCVAQSGEVERTESGFRAIGKVVRMSDGLVISTAEGFVGDDEPVWSGGTDSRGKTHQKRAEYAIRAMAQTRAISRACRSAFAHVVVMMNAGLSTTPAEEVPEGGFQDTHTPAPAPKSAPASKPAPASRPAPAPQGDGDSGTLVTGIDKVSVFKTGKTAKGTWTLWEIIAGERYTTFDKKVMETAKAAHEDGKICTLEWKTGKFGRELVSLYTGAGDDSETPPDDVYAGELGE